eukprot:Nitzschia sp. Nitz4//scaffold45_size130396//44087//47542//NITZ4_003443-RA/size130396-processed-gene-0.98-mRNA-1//-1//CDS//3329552380//1468//frame0
MSGQSNRRGSYNRSDSTTSGRSGGRKRSSVDPSTLPVEQGIICTLKESFGFIHCADRPEEIFFHYSEVFGVHPDSLQIDTEVEFRVGPSEKDASKSAAYQVRTLSPGTIVWETEEEEGKLFQGIVDRAIRNDSRQGGGGGNRDTDGSIQVLVPNPNGESAEATTNGPMVRFRAEDVIPPNQKTTRLYRGDLVQFRILLDRRTKQNYARFINLVMTEKERARQAREQSLLESASQEEGVVISLNKGYGFLKSNRRHAHVYFHYSNLLLPSDDFQLHKGQEMKFLVVSEVVDGQTKYSARQLECVPKGTVQFHTVVARGIKGIVTLCPLPPSAGNNPGYADDKDGSIRLIDPIIDHDDEGNEITITDLSFEFNDAPGGVYTFQQRGNTTNGLWILEGDVLLFDVVKELADGSYEAAPTNHTLAVGGKVIEPAEDASKEEAVIRLVACSLVSRAEGIMHTLKPQGGYGFIHYAERSVDVHFQTYNLLPEELQVDLRKHLGFEGEGLKLEPGVGVQFDICAHGVLQVLGRGAGGGGRRRGGGAQERENVKAHRVLLLPPSSVLTEKVLASGVKGSVVKADTKQLYAGFVDLEAEITEMTLAERHPQVTQLIESFLVESAKPHGRKQIVFSDIQSTKEDEVVIQVATTLGSDVLACSHIPIAGLDHHPGRLCIRRLMPDERPPKNAEVPSSKGPSKHPLNEHLRYDKASLADQHKEEMPPGTGDIVTCDVVQSRRTGKISIHNMKVVERKEGSATMADAMTSATIETSGIGIVQNVIPKSGFGFISVVDSNANRQELLFFSLNTGKDKKKSAAKKGDEVKFDIGVDPKSGKRVAQNVEVVAKGTVPQKAAKNACRGIVLMEPTQTTSSENTLRKKHSSDSAGSGGRWGNLTDDSRKTHSGNHERGVILLLEDTAGVFSGKSRRRRATSFDSTDSDDKSIGDASFDSYDTSDDDRSTGASDDEFEPRGTLLSHLPYKKGVIAVVGAGSSNGMASSGNPHRGDIVTFSKARKGKSVVDVRVESRKSATVVTGRLENIQLADHGLPFGSAKFIAATEKQESYEVDLAEVVSCDVTLLKEQQQVEGILHDGKVYGICRTSDLYLESKFGQNRKERPRLNLTAKKSRGGTIMAQSMMAKGPDGTTGFAPGWTSRLSTTHAI